MGTLKEEAAKFKPVDISKLMADDNNVTDAMRTACSLYNSALREIAGGSVNEARSDLRKAAALCPEFNYAIILYGICTFYTGDRTGAMRIFNSVKTPAERSRAMRIYDRLVDEELSVNSAEVAGARLRKSLESFDDSIESVYKRRDQQPAENEIIRPRSLFIDGEETGDGSGVKITTSGWSGRRGNTSSSGSGNSGSGSAADDPTEVRRRKTVVTVHKLPELEEEPPQKPRRPGLHVLLIIILLAALLIALVGWGVTHARYRALKKQAEPKAAVAAIRLCSFCELGN